MLFFETRFARTDSIGGVSAAHETKLRGIFVRCLASCLSLWWWWIVHRQGFRRSHGVFQISKQFQGGPIQANHQQLLRRRLLWLRWWLNGSMRDATRSSDGGGGCRCGGRHDDSDLVVFGGCVAVASMVPPTWFSVNRCLNLLQESVLDWYCRGSFQNGFEKDGDG